MPTFKLAHVREQGQDMIFVPLDTSTLHLPQSEHRAIADGLQAKATESGLQGTVVLCWYEFHRWHFFGPQQWSGFFQSLPATWVSERINRTLTW